MRRLLVGAILSAALLVGAGSGPSSKLGPCKSEDSTHCYWDAQTMGNGRGHDVVTP